MRICRVAVCLCSCLGGTQSTPATVGDRKAPWKPPLMKSNRCCESSDAWWNSWKFFRRPWDCWPHHRAPATGAAGASKMFRYLWGRARLCATILFEGPQKWTPWLKTKASGTAGLKDVVHSMKQLWQKDKKCIRYWEIMKPMFFENSPGKIPTYAVIY